MALGKTHDSFNLYLGAIFVGFLIGFHLSLGIILAFSLGWLISTFIFSPDTDLMPKKRSKFFRFFLYPYSIIFSHRGISHSFFFGTFTRVLYCLVLFGGIIFAINKMGYVRFSIEEYLSIISNFILFYDYKIEAYRLVSWLLIGLFLADSSHLFLDLIYSVKTRVKRLFTKKKSRG